MIQDSPVRRTNSLEVVDSKRTCIIFDGSPGHTVLGQKRQKQGPKESGAGSVFPAGIRDRTRNKIMDSQVKRVMTIKDEGI